jgi:hypothetical protein
MGFPDFIRTVFPGIKKTPLPEISTYLISNLINLCPVIVRGGAMRRLLFPYLRDRATLLSRQIAAIPEKDIGHEPMTRAVLDHALGPPDLDLFLLRPPWLTDEHIRHSLVQTLQCQGKNWEDARLVQFSIGARTRHPLFGVHFFQPGDSGAVFQVNFTGYPEKPAQWEDEIRIYAKPDHYSLGTVLKDKSGTLSLSYAPNFLPNKYDDEFFWVTTGGALTKAGENFTAAAAQYFREIAMSCSLSALTAPWLTLTDIEKIDFIRNQWEPAPTDDTITGWIASQKTDIEGRLVPMLSDISYGFIVDPIIALCQAYTSHSLRLLPLGRIITDWPKLKQVVQGFYHIYKLDEQKPLNHTALSYTLRPLDPLLIVDILKGRHLLADDYPRTYSALIMDLLNPLKLLPT